MALAGPRGSVVRVTKMDDCRGLLKTEVWLSDSADCSTFRTATLLRLTEGVQMCYPSNSESR